VIGSEPAIDDFGDFDVGSREREPPRCFLASMARVALYVHGERRRGLF
jgi:hypothetical protein